MLEQRMITVFFDGLCSPRNPGGVAAYGYLIYRNGELLHRGWGVVGEGRGMTNNVAEYEALLAAIRWIQKNAHGESVVFKGDSRLVIKQMSGEWKVRSDTSRRYVPLIKSMLEGIDHKFVWIPREENVEADALSKHAYEMHRRGRQE
ncbi:MAG: ribonuclease HI [Methanothrix sp.]|jgi:ribonuclease HI|uniref:ribonuclease HI n=1 Tax=Methanothrix sp. TaxID=90426 RepID=UPI00247BE032|nr:ribonuclease HI [Methanothrix sp.]